MNWLNSPWVVGIGGGILSGLVVAWISRMLLSKREDRERQQKVQAANRELIFAIRPGISEGVLPSPGIVDALIESTGRRYGVNSWELYGPAEIAEELTKDVMDSSFLSAKAKFDYCERLIALRDKALEEEREMRREQEEAEKVVASSDRTAEVMSGALGLITLMMTLLGVLSAKDDIVTSLWNEKTRVLLPGLLSVLAVVLAMAVSFFKRRFSVRVEREKPAAESGEEREAKAKAADKSEGGA